MDTRAFSIASPGWFTVFFVFITATSGLICPRYCRCDRRERSVSCTGYTHASLPARHVPESVRSFALINQSLSIFNDSWSALNLDLREIKAINCDIFNMTHDSLRGFRRLRILHLDINYLTEIPFCISNSSSIRDLSLSANFIQELPLGVFDNLAQLRILQLAQNRILHFPDTVLQMLTELRVLNISHNRIQVITKRTFANLTKLTDLDLSSNQVTSLSFGWLDSLTNLWVLNLNDFFGEIDPEDTKAEINLLGLSNELEFANLETLDISTNNLTKIPCYRWGTMPTLMYLTMNNNNFNVVPEFCFTKLDDLHELRIIDCSISLIEACAFCSMPHLHKLDISLNFISSLPHRLFEGTNLLNFLRLEANDFTYLPDDFVSRPFLEYLYLSQNKIHNISEFAFRSLPSLILLDLKENKLTSVTNEFKRARSLHFIQLVYNRIKFVDEEAFYNCTSIQAIYLEGNRMTTITLATFEPLRNLQSVSLTKNKWECDCNLRWMHPHDDTIPDKKRERMNWLKDLEDVRCTTPKNYKRHHIHTIKFPSRMICSSFPPPLTISLIVNISVAIVGISTALYVIQLYCKARKVERNGGDIGKCLRSS